MYTNYFFIKIAKFFNPTRIHNRQNKILNFKNLYYIYDDK